MKDEKLMGATSNRFRCIRCKGIYKTQKKLEAHAEACNIAHGTTGIIATGTLLEVIAKHGVAAVSDAMEAMRFDADAHVNDTLAKLDARRKEQKTLRATLATKGAPKIAVAGAAGRSA